MAGEVWTRAEHYREASTLLTGPACEYDCPDVGCRHERATLRRVELHARLAALPGKIEREAIELEEQVRAGLTKEGSTDG